MFTTKKMFDIVITYNRIDYSISTQKSPLNVITQTPDHTRTIWIDWLILFSLIHKQLFLCFIKNSKNKNIIYIYINKTYIVTLIVYGLIRDKTDDSKSVEL